MLHRTSREGFACLNSSTPFEAILYDFDIDGAKLKSAHKHFLDTVVVPAIRCDQSDSSKKWHVLVEGRTSRSGTDQHNGPLSKQRAQNVLDYILDRVPKEFLVAAVGKGEIPAALAGEKDGTEDMFYRGVSISIWGNGQPPPPPRPPTPKVDPPKPKLPSARKPYLIRMLSGATTNYQLPVPGPIQKVVQAGISKDLYLFVIRDVEEKVSYTYVLDAMGQSLGPSLNYKNLSQSKTFEGNWSEFTAPRWVAANDFAGPAILESAGISWGANSKSVTTLSFRPLHWYSPGPSFRVRLETGRTIGSVGIGVSNTVGDLRLIGKGPEESE
jgi:hypothetical protein